MIGGGKNIIEIVLAAKDTTSKAFTKVQTQMKGLKGAASKMGATMKSVGGKIKWLMGSIGPLIGIAGIAGIAMALKGTITTFGKFEQAAANAASVTGKTGQAFKDTRQHIMAVSKVLGETTVFTASQAADAFYDLASAGYDVAKITKNELKPVLDLAAATQSDLKATTEVVTSTLGQFGLTMKNSKDVADIFARTIGSSKATLEKLGVSLAYVGPVAHSLGMSLEETNGILGILYNKGYDASMAGTALRGAFTRLLTPTSAAKDIFAKLGVTMTEVNPETNSMADILSTLKDAGMDTADAMEIFGRRAGPAMLALTGSTDDIRTLTVELQNAGGAAAIMAEQQLATFEGRMALVKSKLEATAIALGGKLAPALVAAANGLTDKVIPAFQEFGESLRNQLTPAFGPLKEKMVDAFDKMSGGITLMERLDDVGVILGAMLKPLADHWGWLIEKLGPLWDLIGKVGEGFHTLANTLRTEQGHIDNIKDAINELNKSKESLIVLNEKLNIKTAALASELEKAGWAMEKINELEEIAKEKTDALAEARIKANEALAARDMDAYNLAMEDVVRLEGEAKTATENLNDEVSGTAQLMIDAGTATDGVKTSFTETNKAADDLSEGLATVEDNVETLEEKMDDATKASSVLKEGFGKFWEGAKEAVGGAVDFIDEKLGWIIEKIFGFVEAVIGAYAEMGSAIKSLFTTGGFAEASDETQKWIDKGIKIINEGTDKWMEDYVEFGEKAIDTNKEVGESTSETTQNMIEYWNESIKQIDAALEVLKEEYASADEAAKKRLKKQIANLYEEKKGFEDLLAGVNDVFDGIENAVQKGTDATTDFGDKTKKSFSEVSIEIGNTEVTFKGLASEVMKNVDSFEDLQKTAQTLIDMNWQVFRDLEAVLPEIGTGIGDMESAFAGLQIVLEDNLTKLESVKESIESIGDMIGPYIEEGFLDGIKAIGDFASALSDAGSAINTFGSLTEANVEGCIKFSTNIHGMVSALKVLESQMADLMPSFGDMNSLIGNIAETFVYTEGKIEAIENKMLSYGDTATKAYKDMGYAVDDFNELYSKYTQNLEDEDIKSLVAGRKDLSLEFVAMTSALRDSNIVNTDFFNIAAKLRKEIYLETGMIISSDEALRLLIGTKEENIKWMEEELHTSKAIEFQLDKQTNALKYQTEQLNKITEALQPLLNFLDTLNKIAALSAISQDELNIAFQNILDTLTHLGIALNNIDFETPITNLVKDSESFRTTMEKNAAPLDQLNFYVSLLTDTILGLVQAFEALGSIEESVLKDTDKLEAIFISITTITDNLTEALKDTAKGGKGFADQFAMGFEDMLSAAAPLIDYFRENQAAVIEFNNTLGLFMTTVSHVVDVMQKLKEISELTVPSQTELETAFKTLTDTVNVFSDALSEHLDLSEEGIIQNTDNIINAMEDLTTTWGYYNDAMEDNLPTLQTAATSFSSLSSGINTLINAYKDIKDSVIPTAADYVVFLEKSTLAINEFQKGLDIFLESPDNLFKAMESLIGSWEAYDRVLEDNLPTLQDAASSFSSLSSAINTLINAYKDIKDKVIPTSDDYVKFLEITTNAIGEFQKGLDMFDPTTLFKNMEDLTATWESYDKTLEDNLPTLKKAGNAFSSLSSGINTLINAYKDIRDIAIPTSEDYIIFLEKSSNAIAEFAKGLSEYSGDLLIQLSNFTEIWQDYDKTIEDNLPTLKKATDAFGTLTSSILSLISGFESLKDATELTFDDFDDGMKKITRTIPRFTRALEINMDAIAQVLKDLDAVWSKYAEDMEDIIPSASGATSAFTKLTSSVLALSDAFTKLMEFGEMSEANFDAGLQKLMRTFDNFAKSLDKNIEALMASLHSLVTEWLENEDQMVYLMRAFTTIAGNFITVIGYALRLADAFDALKGKTGIIKDGFDDLIGVIGHLLSGLEGMYSMDAAKNMDLFIVDVGSIITALTNLKTTLNVDVATAFGNLSKTIEDASGKAITAIGAIGEAVNSLLSAIREAASGISNNFRNAITSIEGIMASLSASAYGWGHSLMWNFVEGIYSEMGALVAAMQNAAGIVNSYIGVASPTEKGPLASLEEFGPNLVRSFQKGIEEGLPGLNRTLSGLSMGGVSVQGGMAGMAGGNSVKNVYMTINQNINNREDARYAVAEIERVMRKPAIL